MDTVRGQIAAVGRKDDIIPFRATGAAIHITGDPGEAGRILHSLVEEGYSLIFVTEDLWQGMGADAKRYLQPYLPAISVIPGRDGTSRIALEMMYDEVKRAVGIDIRKDGRM